MAKTHKGGWAVSMPKEESVHIRRIDNGFIMRRSSSGPDGYKESESYHEKNPLEMSKASAQAKTPATRNPNAGGKPKAEPPPKAMKMTGGPKAKVTPNKAK